MAMAEAFQGFQAGLWTAIPAVIKSFDPVKMSASAQPTIQAKIVDALGAARWVSLPLLVDCPVVFPGGGGFTLTFPLVDGDECLVVFASRCIDAWWQSGGVQVQSDTRLHDLSDGFVLAGVRSQPRVLTPSVVTTGIELRNDDQTAYIRIDDAETITVQTSGNITASADGDAYVEAGGDVVITAPTITLNGNLHVNGSTTISGGLTAGGKNVGGTHTHGGVQTGGGTSGVPT